MTVAPAPSDAALVARLRSRDRTAWEDVYALYGDRLYKFAYHLAGNPHDAADLVQETFVRVLPKLDSLDPETLDLGAYLFATQRNLFLKQVERAKRQQPVDEIPEPDGPRPIEDDPQRSTLLADQQERVRRANAALAPRQRLVLALRELEDRSYAEIGELVGLKENAVAQLISRARLRLREELRLVEVDRSKLPAACQAMLPLLSQYLDGQLQGRSADETIAHVESCEDCQRALVEMREASRLYRALLPIPFPELYGRIDDALAASGFLKPAASVLKSKGAWLAAAALVASLALVVLLGATALREDAEPTAAPAPTTPTPSGPAADTTPPGLVVPRETIVREATSAPAARVTFRATAEDDVDGPVDVTCAPASGEVFFLGTTEVSCSARDASGNVSRASFAVEIVDAQAPVVTAPAALRIEATSAQGAPVAYRASARDRADPAVTIRCTPRAGAVLPLGETTVACTARDAAGNVARTRFVVTVVDSTPPALVLPDALAVEAGTPTVYEASARDTVDGAVEIDCLIPSGRVLPLGRTVVECSSEDAAGNVARKSFVVRVGDTTAPTLRLPGDLTVEATGRRTRVPYTATAREPGGSALPVRCRPDPRALFPLGVTTVRCSARDRQGNVASGSFRVRVVDRTAPLVVAPSAPTVEATGPTGAKVDFVAKASDRVDPRPQLACAPASGSVFPLGTTTVTCTAHDAGGNRAAASFVVTVVDTTPPVLALPPNRTVQATSPRGATVTYSASATDLVDGSITPACSPAAGALFPVGTTNVTCTARDARGNASTATFAVTVTPLPQADLVVSSVTGTRFTITNRGNAAAGPFVVTVQGVGTFTFAGLAAGASVSRTVSCASIQRTVRVDAQNQVSESNETNNTAVLPPC